MNTSLARIPETSEESLTRIAESIKLAIKEDNQSNAQVVVDSISRSPGLIARLLPSAVEKENQRLAVEALRKMAARKESMLAWYGEVQLEIARKQGDAVIAATGVYLQEKLASFAAQKLTELEITIEQSIMDFIDRYEPKKLRIEGTKEDHPELYNRAAKTLDHMLETHFETLEELLTGFKAALRIRAA